MQNQVANLPFQTPMPRPKKRSRNETEWKQNKVKKGRIEGKLHFNYKGQLVQPKVLADVNCRCVPECTGKFSAAEKTAIFTKFYSFKTHEEQTLYLKGCVIKTGPENTAYANDYYLRTDNQSILVCQKYLLGILGVKRSRLRRKVLNTVSDVADKRGKHCHHLQISPAAVQTVRAFLFSLDARESHYSRQNNKHRKYLESEECISSLYQKFITEHVEFGPYAVKNLNEPPVQIKKWNFEKIFNFEFNIAFGYPRSDICCICTKNSVEQKMANIHNNQQLLAQLKAVHTTHLDQAQEFYNSLNKDTTKNLGNDVACICFDYEKNLPLPVTNVTNEFFARQLWIYNFGIHDVRTGSSRMYMYSETFCHKGPNEVISALNHYITNYIPPEKTKVHFFCDNSSGQNKNKYLLAYLSTLHHRFDEVTLSFPVVGHSRMPCDRDFAQVERQKNKKDKFEFPSCWTSLVRKAQIQNPFAVVYLEHPLTDDLCDDGTSIAKCLAYKTVMEPLLKPPKGIMSMKGFHFDNNGNITSRKETSGPYNLNFRILKPGVTMNVLLNDVNHCTAAFDSYVPIKKAKFDNVKMLLENMVIPDHKIFYESLVSNNNNDLGMDEEAELQNLLDEDEDA